MQPFQERNHRGRGLFSVLFLCFFKGKEGSTAKLNWLKFRPVWHSSACLEAPRLPAVFVYTKKKPQTKQHPKEEEEIKPNKQNPRTTNKQNLLWLKLWLHFRQLLFGFYSPRALKSYFLNQLGFSFQWMQWRRSCPNMLVFQSEPAFCIFSVH